LFNPDHQHLLVDAVVKNPLKEVVDLNKWLEELVSLVQMKVVAGPTSVRVEDLGNEGLTGTITLATSHAAIHIWEAADPVYLKLDLYSCKDYDNQVVLDHLDKAMGLVSYKALRINRNGTDYSVVKVD
jgi:S-adenosylmethionine/arginine decarboxylase-like enzyme